MSCLFVSGDQNVGTKCFSISPSSEYSGLISLKIDRFDLLAIQGTFRSLLQPALEFEGISSLVLCLLYSQLLQPHMTNVVDSIGGWEDHSFEYMDLCWQSNVSAFQHCLSLLSCQEAIIFWFHGCSYHPQWFWSPRRGNQTVLLPFPLLFPCSYEGRYHVLSFFFFFGCLVLSHLFHASSPSSRGSSVLLHFLPVEWCYLHIWGCWYFSHLSWFQLVTHPAWHFSWCAQHIA